MKKLGIIVLFILISAAITVSIAVSCDTNGHEHVYIEQRIEQQYLATEKSCTKKATYYYSCACGEKGKGTFDVGEPAGHSFTNYVSDNNATCAKDGTKTAKCDRCDETSTTADAGSKTFDHAPGAAKKENVVGSTCTKTGSYDEVVYCSVCSTELSRETKQTDKIEHDPAEAVKENIVSATCITVGSYDEVVYCTACNAELSRTTKELNKTAHTPDAATEENRIEATCTKEGRFDIVIYCSFCLSEISRTTKTIGIIPHNSDSGTITKPVTCTSDGEKMYSCTECGTTIRTETLKSTGHNYDDGKVTKVQTCIDNGEKAYTCSGCGDVKTEVLPANGHTEVAIGTGREATCKETGFTKGIKCSVCGTIIEEQRIIPFAEHNFVDGVCTVCKKEKEYTVTFVIDGEIVSVQTYTANNKQIKEPNIPEKVGYEVIGWQKYSLIGDITVNAVYEAKEYRITLNPRGGVCEKNAVDVIFGTTYKLPVPENNDYLFAGWFSSASSDAIQYTDGKGISLSVYDYAGNKQFYAHWSAPEVEILLDYDNDNPICKIIIEYGTAFVVDDEPVKDNCIFDGWYTSDGEEYTYTTIVCKSVTLKAKWTVSKPISSADELFAIADDPAANYHLTKDITLPNSKKVWKAIPDFSGILNGNGYTITNIAFTVGDNASYGFVVNNNGVIENLNFNRVAFTQKLSSFYNDYDSGIIAGINNGVIKNCHLISGNMTCTANSYIKENYNKSLRSGTIAGLNNGSISDCTSEIDFVVEAEAINSEYWGNPGFGSLLGGIAGCNKGEISNCSFGGTLAYSCRLEDDDNRKSGAWSNPMIGGLVGENYGGVVKRCYAVTDILMTISLQENRDTVLNAACGGLIGKNNNAGVVENSFAQGGLTIERKTGKNASLNIGGFVGYNVSNSSIYNCYTTVDLKVGNGSTIGGFVGKNDGANISGCYSSGDVVATAGGTIGGFIGVCTNAGGSVSNSYSCGNVTANAGTAGMFVGSSSIAISDCYFMKDAHLTVGGVLYDRLSELNDTIDGKACYDIWSEAFLSGELFWMSEDGWVILTDEDPIFDWEIKVFHDYETYVFEPTCEDYGYTLYLCNDCTRFFIRDIVKPLGHLYDAEHPIVKAATCMESGYKYYVCLREGCTEENGKVYTKEIYEPLGHTAGDIVYGTDSEGKEKTYSADCENEGRTTYKCTVCQKEFSVIVPALNHDRYESIAEKPASCYFNAETGEYITMAGYTAEIKCKRCKAVLQASEQIEPHHRFNYDYETEPTCTTDGVGTATCEMCNYVMLTSRIPALGHIDKNDDHRCDRCHTYMISSSEEAKEGEYTLIKDVNGLKAIANNLKGTYILEKDIVLSDVWTPIGTKDNPFTGQLFGEGHTIKGLYLKDTETGGLFGYNNGFIGGVTLDGINISAYSIDCVIGGIVAYNRGVVLDCKVQGDVKIGVSVDVTTDQAVSVKKIFTNTIGGIVGRNERLGTISSCTSSATYENVFTNTARTTFKTDYNWFWSVVNKLFSPDRVQYKRYATTSIQTVYFGQICGLNFATIGDCKALGTGNNLLSLRAETLHQAGTAFAHTIFWQQNSLCGNNKGLLDGINEYGPSLKTEKKMNHEQPVEAFYYKMNCLIEIND